MSQRLSTWWRALAVTVVLLAPFAWTTSATAATSTPLHVVHQDAVIKLGQHGAGRFTMTLRVPSSLENAPVAVSFFPAVTTRGALTPIIDGQGVTGATVGSARLKAGCVTRGLSTLSITVFTQRPVAASGGCESARTAMRLRCATASCAGVYPIRLTIGSGSDVRTRWSLVTVSEGSVGLPLRVALIESLSPESLRISRTTAVLDAIAKSPDTPISLATNYETLSRLGLDPSTPSTLTAALTSALESPQHQIVNAPPGRIDYGGLSRNGLTNQVRDQINLTNQLIQSLTGRYSAGPILLSGSPSVVSVRALASTGATNLVVPEGLLSTTPSSTLTWGSPFHLTGVNSALALSTDEPLSQLMTDTAIDPGRRAAMTIAALDFLHFEAPNAPQPRTVVLSAPITETSTSYVTALLRGLRQNPFLTPSSLGPSFDSSLVGTNGAPSSLSLSPVIYPAWSSHNVNSLLSLIGRMNSFAPAVSSLTERTQLRVAVAQAEIIGSVNARQSAINSASSLLDSQLQHFAVDPSTITLAGAGTSLPVTVINHAGYSVSAVAHLITDRLTFPKGSSVDMTLASPTNTVRVPVSGARGSSLTLQVVVTTPNSQLVLARAAIQVRIAGASVVGYLLTIASVAVLGWWWWRTNRRRSKGRHAR